MSKRMSIPLCLTVLVGWSVARGQEATAEAAALWKQAGVSGGLVVLAGKGEPAMAAEWAGGGNCLIHVLRATPEETAEARAYLQQRGCYGVVSAEAGSCRALAYDDNLVNLLVVDDPQAAGADARGVLKEILRVLAPNGVALVRQGQGLDQAALAQAGLPQAETFTHGGGAWLRFRKPAPAGMEDGWTHERRDAAGTRVSRDQAVGAPTDIRWLAGPIWPTGERKSSTVAMLSAGGRNFYMLQSAARGNYLIARDACNGLLAWERVWPGTYTPVVQGGNGGYGRRYAPLVAADGLVFGPVDRKVLGLDWATGQTRFTYTSEYPQHLVYNAGVLLVTTLKKLQAFEAATGKPLWAKDIEALDVRIEGENVYLLETAKRPYGLLRLALKTGEELFRTATDWAAWDAQTVQRAVAEWGPVKTRVVHLVLVQPGVVVLAFDKAVYGVSGEDGRLMWTYKEHLQEKISGQGRGMDLVFMNGLVWVALESAWVGLDPQTGQVRKKGPRLANGCQATAVSERFFFARFLSTVSTADGSRAGGIYSKSPCSLGGLPAHGLFQIAPSACQCSAFPLRAYAGFVTRPEAERKRDKDVAHPLEKGPAYAADAEAPAGEPPAGDWPTFLHDPRRSGAASGSVSAEPLWEAQLGVKPPAGAAGNARLNDWGKNPIVTGPLSAPVVAEGRLFVSLPDRHQVLAADARTGKELWRFTADGRVVLPPTVHQGLCLVGACDGWVYALRAADGALAWRLRAAPHERRIVAFGQLESSWPVYGVLVEQGTAFCAAGRAADAEGGLRVLAIEPRAGKVLWEKAKPAKGGKTVLPNSVMVSDGDGVFLDQWKFDPRTGQDSLPQGHSRTTPLYKDRAVLYGCSTYGLLDGSWAKPMPQPGRASEPKWRDGRGAEGHILVLDGQRVFGAGPSRKAAGAAPIFAQDAKGKPLWSVPAPAGGQAEALIKVGDSLVAAGPNDAVKRDKGFLWVLSAEDGKPIARRELPAPPALHGLAAANGLLYVACQDGKVHCLGKGAR